MNMNVKDMTFCAIFAALIAAMAQISIPMPAGVPMTMQTFAISLAGVVLGSRKGFLAALVYVLMGAVGLPVFAHFTGGIGQVLGATGGFILSFPLMAYVIGLGAERSNQRLWLPIALVLGTLLNYLVGMAYFVIVMSSTWQVAFTACVLPFIPTAIIKAVAAGCLGVKVRRRAEVFLV